MTVFDMSLSTLSMGRTGLMVLIVMNVLLAHGKMVRQYLPSKSVVICWLKAVSGVMVVLS